MFTPGVLVASCSSLSPINIIQGIIGQSEPQESNDLQLPEDVLAYPWHIDTKYYSADINLYAIKSKNLFSEEFQKCINAIVLHFDNSQKDGLDSGVGSWLPFLEHYDTEVRLLVCDQCSTDDTLGAPTQKEMIWKWCLSHGFELVELNPHTVQDDETEDDFPETTGYRRIVQALHAHMWPNMILRDSPQFPPSHLAKFLSSDDEEHHDQTSSESSSQKKENAQSNAQETPFQPLLTPDLDNLEDSNFEDLFEKLADLKDKASTLEASERKKYAEKVTLAFWRALGGDAEEIAGLSSSGED